MDRSAFTKEVLFSVRMPEDLVSRIDGLIPVLSDKISWARVTRASVIRYLCQHGVEQLEQVSPGPVVASRVPRETSSARRKAP